METELVTYIILLFVAIIIAAFFAIRRKFKRVIFLVVLIALLIMRVGSIKIAIEYAKKCAAETEIILENDDTENQQEITIKLPKFDFLPEANYYRKSEAEEDTK